MSLENVKVGDWIKVQVTEIDIDTTRYPIKCSNRLEFTLDGKYTEWGDEIAFPLEPTERWMLVSNDSIIWHKRKVIMVKNDYFLTWDGASTDEEVEATNIIINWNYAKEIKPKIEFNLELSLEEIAEKFGVNVEQIKIKK